VADVTLKTAAGSVRLISNPIRNNAAEIEVNAVSPAKVTIELWSLTGVRIASKQQNVGAGINNLQMPLGNVAVGNYVLKLRINDTVQLLQVSKL
jgi:hypothetical protein